MAKNNRKKVSQSKTYSFKIEDVLYIENEAKRLQKSSAQILAMAIEILRQTQKAVEVA
jgi:hypothetical protein